MIYILDELLIKRGWTLPEAMKVNSEKLKSRKERGVLKGSGDNR